MNVRRGAIANDHENALRKKYTGHRAADETGYASGLNSPTDVDAIRVRISLPAADGRGACLCYRREDCLSPMSGRCGENQAAAACRPAPAISEIAIRGSAHSAPGYRARHW